MQTFRTFGERTGHNNNKAAADMTKSELEVVQLELAAAAVVLARPAKARGANEQEALKEIITDIRVTKFTLLAGKCLAHAKKVAIKDERVAWRNQLANFLKGGASIAHKIANADNQAKQTKVDTRSPQKIANDKTKRWAAKWGSPDDPLAKEEVRCNTARLIRKPRERVFENERLAGREGDNACQPGRRGASVDEKLRRLRTILASFPGSTALGMDDLDFRALAKLPDALL